MAASVPHLVSAFGRGRPPWFRRPAEAARPHNSTRCDECMLPTILRRRWAPSSFEELPEHLGTFLLQNTRRQLHLMVQTRVLDDVVEGEGRTGSRILRPVHEASDASENHRAGAHRTGLERDEQFGPLESPRPQLPRRISQDEHLGVGGGILSRLPPVRSGCENLALSDEDGSNRNVVMLEGTPRLLQSESHEIFV